MATPELDGLEPSEHERWLALHQEEAAAAEEWLAGVLGGPPDDRSTGEQPAADQVADRRGAVPAGPTRAVDDWSIERRPGGVVVARHQPTGATFTANLVLRAGDRGARLRVLQYHYAVPGEVVAVGPPPPVELVETAVNEPASMQPILDSLGEVAGAVGLAPPMRIPPALLRGRTRSDEFYVAVAAFVRICRDHKISYGPRLAADNGVSEGTVRSWVHEARRRGLLERRASPRAARRDTDHRWEKSTG